MKSGEWKMSQAPASRSAGNGSLSLCQPAVNQRDGTRVVWMEKLAGQAARSGGWPAQKSVYALSWSSSASAATSPRV